MLSVPAVSGALDNANRTRCLANMKRIASATLACAADRNSIFPVCDNDGQNFGATNATNTWLNFLLPQLGGGRSPSLVCPSVKAKHASLGPTTNSCTTYMLNGLIVGRPLSAIPQPAKTALIREARFQLSAALLRPEFINAGNGNFSYYIFHYSTDSIQNYDNNHRGGGNLIFMDGHGEWRSLTNIRSGDFGLVPSEDDISAPTSKFYQPAR